MKIALGNVLTGEVVFSIKDAMKATVSNWKAFKMVGIWFPVKLAYKIGGKINRMKGRC